MNETLGKPAPEETCPTRDEDPFTADFRPEVPRSFQDEVKIHL
jgi:hypothetical protein